ncbi:hypothetical protein [Segniliparus rugosus]|uniref:Uncharacterized protein n=1 Tax=Segniliparus rugosus (strain ATCC BAA-974 / DSM 45345 / CCUG 50838 / CIP 108380 / JCM 13579 / CDC 945) TaxID=679197 RepID=E5XS30_SEGRC|nr:hypothetical protein [Segniliparus rugosus]EFV12815.1 hypothetical protein HMPREF9336_02302 [Segniliparus rugosus ATCC BAA-974]
MGDYLRSFTDLTTTAEEAPALVERVVGWLLAEQIIEEPQQRSAHSGLRYGAGPSWRASVEPTSDQSFGGWLEVRVERDVVCAFQCFGDPMPGCPRCRTPYAQYMEHFEGWYAGSEPTIACPSCGHVGPLGDWHADEHFNTYPGNYIFQFVNWHKMREPFAQALMDRLGPRPRRAYGKL